MSYDLPPLNWLRTFEAAARQASFTSAAKELHMTQPAVSNHIRSLEEYTGYALFIRHARRVEVSEMGAAYLPGVRQALSQLAGATAGLFGLQGQRAVTISCNPSFATLWLAPRLPRFVTQHPNVDLRLFYAPWTETQMRQHADLDILYGEYDEQSFASHNVELLYRDPSVPLCSPAVRRRLGNAPTLQACAAAPLIHIMGCENFWARWMAEGGIDELSPWHGIKVDSSMTALELAASGYGLALVLKRFAQPYLDAGRLVMPVEHTLGEGQSLYIARPREETPIKPEVRLLRAWLMHEIHRDRQRHGETQVT